MPRLNTPPPADRPPHPICVQLHIERMKAGLSLSQLSKLIGVPDVVIGSYERGDQRPNLQRLEPLVAHFGLEVVLRPIDADGPDAYQRGYDAAIAAACKAWGIHGTDDEDFTVPTAAPDDLDTALAHDQHDDNLDPNFGDH